MLANSVYRVSHAAILASATSGTFSKFDHFAMGTGPSMVDGVRFGCLTSTQFAVGCSTDGASDAGVPDRQQSLRCGRD
jgi:hypothetical protein